MDKKYTQKFRKEWLSDYKFKTWLQEIQGDALKCRCKYCGSVMNARFADLDKHRKTTKHMKAEAPFSNQRLPVITNYTSAVTEVHKTEANMALFIADNCAINLADKLTKLCKESFCDSKNVKNLSLGRTKCSAIISNVLAPDFREKLRNDIGNSAFSLIIDESNDISVTKILGLVIRYYSHQKKRIIVTFLDMVDLKECDANAICEAIKSTLIKHGLDLQNLIALGTDNASVMVGINNGVYKKLKEDVPNLLLIRCVCHSLQLAVSHAVKFELPRHVEYFIRETYNWFSHSYVRISQYKKIYSDMNDGHTPLNLIQPNETRWMSIEKAISRILSQWNELQEHFNEARVNQRCYTAELLYQMFCDDSIKLYLLFTQPIIAEVSCTNKIFESDVNDPTKLFKDLVHLIKSLCSKIAIPGSNITENIIIENHLMPNPYLGYEFENQISTSKLSDEIKHEIRSRCTKFLLLLIKQLQQRLPSNIHILQNMSMFNINECLNAIKPNILSLAEIFINDGETLTKVDFQWKKIHTVQWKEKLNTSSFWIEVASYKDAIGENPFEDLVNLAFKFLSLPHSNAEVERLFSQMNLIKTKLRNRMHINKLNDILTIKYGLRNGNNYTLSKEVISKIGTMKTYRSDDPQNPTSSSNNDTEILEIFNELGIALQ